MIPIFGHILLLYFGNK